MVLSYPVLRHYNISHKDSFDKKSGVGLKDGSTELHQPRMNL
jgi:hypothetical protein